MVFPIQVINKNKKFPQKKFDFKVISIILFGGVIIACESVAFNWVRHSSAWGMVSGRMYGFENGLKKKHSSKSVSLEDKDSMYSGLKEKRVPFKTFMSIQGNLMQIHIIE